MHEITYFAEISWKPQIVFYLFHKYYSKCWSKHICIAYFKALSHKNHQISHSTWHATHKCMQRLLTWIWLMPISIHWTNSVSIAIFMSSFRHKNIFWYSHFFVWKYKFVCRQLLDLFIRNLKIQIFSAKKFSDFFFKFDILMSPANVKMFSTSVWCLPSRLSYLLSHLCKVEHFPRIKLLLCSNHLAMSFFMQLLPFSWLCKKGTLLIAKLSYFQIFTFQFAVKAIKKCLDIFW